LLACRKLVFSSSKQASLSFIDFGISGGSCFTYHCCFRLAGGKEVSTKPEKDSGILDDNNDFGDKRGFVNSDFVANNGYRDVNVDHSLEPYSSDNNCSDDNKKKFVNCSGFFGRNNSSLSVFFRLKIELKISDSNLDAI
jgi:hypothetical protein